MIPPLLLNVEPHHKVVYQTEDGRGGERRSLSVPLAFSSCICLIMLCILRFCFCSFCLLSYSTHSYPEIASLLKGFLFLT